MVDVAQEEERRGPRNPPEGPVGLGAGSWGGVLERAVTELGRDNVTDGAAALTYYGVLSIFPADHRPGAGAGTGRPLGHAAAGAEPRQARAGAGAAHRH